MAEAKSDSKDFDDIDDLCVRSIGVLAANMVQKANSGHPGAPMGMAAMAHVLWSKVMTGNNANSAFPNRDRFVLSNGHACALQYSMLHLTGYKVAMSDLEAFRQLDSKTPGHPENVLTDGVECSTGPLGQGVAQAVGMAIAAKYAQSMFGAKLFNSTIYALCGDGCLQEGVCAEAASLAGHLQLDNLIVLYDDNNIQIDGSTELAFTEDVSARFAAYKWNVLHVDKGNTNLQGILEAITAAQQTADRPTLICVKTAIGFGSTKEGSHKVHGAPLGDECLAAYQQTMGLKDQAAFSVDDKVYARYAETFGQRGRDAEAAWNKEREGLSADKAKLLTRLLKNELPENWEAALPTFDETSKSQASRNMNGAVLNALAKVIPEIIGGAADLTPSTKTALACSHDFQAKTRDGRYLRFGVREFGMFAVGNGIAAFGLNLIPFTATFLNFLGYGMGAVRLGALSHLRQIYVMTHDSVLLGEDGPTHQPVEALPACRSMPNLLTFRPCDGNEVAQTWRLMLQRTEGPSVIALSRQSIDSALVSKYTKNGVAAQGVAKGCYVLNGSGEEKEEKEKVDVVVIASGSEVELALAAAEALAESLRVRVVSANCLELFDAQPLEYREKVLPPGVLVVSIEASSTYGWASYAHKAIGVPAFGKSAPLKSIREDFGFNAPALIKNIEQTVEAWKKSGKDVPLLPTLYPY